MMEFDKYIAYYESTIFDDSDDREAIIEALKNGDCDSLWYPVAITKEWLFSAKNRLYAGELPDGKRILLDK